MVDQKDMISQDKASLDAIEQIYRDRHAAFLRSASAIANSHEAGRDAVHDAFVSAIRARGSYRGEGSVEAWLWTMVVRSALKLRGNGRQRHTEPEAIFWPESAPEPDMEMRAAVACLPPRQRLILFLRYYGDLDYRTISEATGVKIGTVGAELHAAHQSLRRHLKEVPHT